MKKVLIYLGIFFCTLLLTGCGNNAKMAVKNYLDKYNSLDAEVLSDMNDIITKENLSTENMSTYETIFKKQYSDLSYTIENESYDGDEATVTVKVSVYDLYKVQKEATEYLANNTDEFNDENGVYDVQKYIAYKLDKMQNVTDRVEYTIDFYVVKTTDGWVVSALSSSDLEKIHGIYNYES